MREFAVVVQDRRGTLVQCEDEPDLAVAATLRERLAAPGRRPTDVIIMDLSSIPCVDCADRTALTDLARSCAPKGIGLVLAGLSPLTRRLLTAPGLDAAPGLVDNMVAATRWAAGWRPADLETDAAAPVLPPGPRRCAPAGVERPWYEWR